MKLFFLNIVTILIATSSVLSFEGNIKWIKTGNAYNIFCFTKSKDGKQLISIDEAGYWKFWDYTQKNFDSVSKKEKIHKIIYREQDDNYLAVQTAYNRPGGIALYSPENTILQQFYFGDSFQNYFLSQTKDSVVISKYNMSGTYGKYPNPHVNNDVILCDFINKEQKTLYHAYYKPGQGHTYNFPIISADGKTVVAVNDSGSGSIDYINIDENVWRKKIFGKFYAIYLSSDAKYLFASTKDSSIKVYNWDTGELLNEIRNFGSNVNFYQHSIEQNIYYTIENIGETSKLKFWDLNNLSIIDSLIYNNKQVKNFTFNDSLTTMLYSTSEGHIIEMNLLTKESDTLIKNESLLFNDLAYQKEKYFSVSNNSSIKVWDAENGGFIKDIPNRLGDLSKVRISHDNKKLLTLNQGKIIQKWDIETGEEELTIASHSDGILGLSFSPDGKYLASGSRDQTIKIWDGKNGNYIKTLPPQYSHKISYSYDGKKIIMLSGSSIKVLNSETGELIMHHEDKPKVPIYEWYAYDFALSPDSIHVALTLGDSSIKIINIRDKIIEKTLVKLPYYVTYIDYSTDGKWVAVNCYEDRQNIHIYIIDVNNGEITKKINIKENDNRKYFGDLCFSSDNKFILYQSFGYVLKVNLETEQYPRIINYGWDEVGRNNIERTKNNKYIVCAIAKNVYILDSQDFTITKSFKNNFGGGPYITACSIDEKGEYLALGAQYSEQNDPFPNILMYKLPDVTYRNISGPLSTVVDLKFAPDDSTFTFCDEHNIILNSNTNGNPVDKISDGNYLQSFTYSNDSKFLAYSYRYDNIYYVNIKVKEYTPSKWRKIYYLKKYGSPTLNLIYSPNDKYLLETKSEQYTNERNYYIQLIDTTNGDIIHVFNGHTALVHSMFFTKDSKVIVSGSNDATIRFWNVKEGKEICKIQFPIPYTKIQLSEDDKYVLAGTYDGSVIMYDVTEEIARTLAATDIPEQNNEFDFECFPNPATNKISLNYKISNSGRVEISVIDIFGNSKINKSEYKLAGLVFEVFETSTLPNGIYFITIKSGAKVLSKQFVILR